MFNADQLATIHAGQGFIAALDQSGGSTPKALRLYGIGENAYANEEEMFDKIHQMRTRIVKSPAFSGDRVVGAILFENTMDRLIDGKPAPTYLWEERGVVPFLKVDKGLQDASNDVKLMKPISGLDDLCKRAAALKIFGTKIRSVIDGANSVGIKEIVDQQFAFGNQILSHGLVPILEPEITISIKNKAKAEDMLLVEILSHLDAMDQDIMLKLTLPEKANQYKALVDHPRVISVVALSGGYTRDEANARLAQNTGMIASFSRALTESLNEGQSEAEFDAILDVTIDSIYRASIAG